jgi:hypothetical protein
VKLSTAEQTADITVARQWSDTVCRNAEAAENTLDRDSAGFLPEANSGTEAARADPSPPPFQISTLTKKNEQSR